MQWTMFLCLEKNAIWIQTLMHYFRENTLQVKQDHQKLILFVVNSVLTIVSLDDVSIITAQFGLK